MKKLLIATTNKAKLQEISHTLRHLIERSIEVLSLKDVGITTDVEETGNTFLENAKLKAEFYGKLSNILTIADDGGLMIDALNGEPGVKSRRWPGYEATDQELIDMALNKLQGIPKEQRTAEFRTCLYFYDPANQTAFFEEESVKGSITEAASERETNGYPFRTLFIVAANGKLYDDLTEEEHHEINHRVKALMRLSRKIEKYLVE